MSSLLDISLLKTPAFFRKELKAFDSRLDRVTLGDCITEMKSLPRESVDFVLTDPPYATRYHERSGRKIINDDNSDWIHPAFAEAYRALKPDSFCVSFYGWNKVDVFLSAWKKSGFRPVGHLTWIKRYPSSVGYTKMCHECAYVLVKGSPQKPSNPLIDVLGWEYTGNKLHPTQKPVSSLVPVIEAFCPKGGCVLDPFGGSGSTAVAARKCGRHFVLFEKDPVYFEASRRRLERN